MYINNELYDNTPLQNILDSLQIEKGSSATSYEPYENICPIEGWNNVEVIKTGKNLAKVAEINWKKWRLNSNVFTPVADNSSTITYTINNDESITITNTYNWYGIGFNVDAVNYERAFSVTPAASSIRLFSSYELDATVVSIKHGTSYVIIPANTSGFVGIRYDSVDTRNIKVQFEKGSSITDYESYCGTTIPITFPVTGKNKIEIVALNSDNWTGEGYSYYYLTRMNPIIDIENGTISITCQGSGDSILYRKTHYPPGTYTLSFDMTISEGHTGTPKKRVVVICFDKNDNILTNEDISIQGLSWNQYYKGFFNDAPKTFTIPDTVAYFTICFGIAGDTKNETATFSNIQLELGSTATTYVPYNADNTYYGGYVDVSKGEIVAEWKIDTTNGRSWELSSDRTVYSYTVQWGHTPGKGYSSTERPNAYHDSINTHC